MSRLLHALLELFVVVFFALLLLAVFKQAYGIALKTFASDLWDLFG